MAAATAAFVTGTGNMQRTRLVMTQPWRSGLIAYVRLWVREGARVSLQLWVRRRLPAREARSPRNEMAKLLRQGENERNRLRRIGVFIQLET